MFDGIAFGDTFVDEERYAERDMLANVMLRFGHRDSGTGDAARP
jgi:hypothetical protein